MDPSRVVTRVTTASQPRSYGFETSGGAHLQRDRRFIYRAEQNQLGQFPHLNCKPEIACKDQPTSLVKKPELNIGTVRIKNFSF